MPDSNDLAQLAPLVAAEARRAKVAAEARRAKKRLRAPEQPRPYYVSHLIRETGRHRFGAAFGAIYEDERRRFREGFADVRVGSYAYDHVQGGGLEDNDTNAESFKYATLPITGGRGFEHALWRLTECRYREAVESMLRKRAAALHMRDPNAALPAFQRRRGKISLAPEPAPEVDVARWRRYVQRASAYGNEHPGLYNSFVQLSITVETRLQVDTEGNQILERRPYWDLQVNLDLDNGSGIEVPWNLHWLVTDPAELPSLRRLRSAFRQAVPHLAELAAAPTLRAYSGPVWLDPQPAGLLVHEALGHRFEGNRLLSDGEGQTFRDAVGEDLLPDFLHLYDDPTLRSFEGQSLAGHYLFDDEGVAAARADLVQAGRVAGFLTSRAGIAERHRSNGHARASGAFRPMSRMGVTVLEADGGLTDAAMKRALIDEVERAGLPFGLHIKRAEGGETTTKAYEFQAFLGQVTSATRVFPDGREELVRGVNFVGTPLNALRGVLAAGTRSEVDNSYCGAESGWVPVSTISPSLLIEDLEIQSDPARRMSPFTYPMPE